MNIALINSPTVGGKGFIREGRCTQEASLWATQWPPISLAYIASVLTQGNDKTFIYDCPATQISLHKLISKLSEKKSSLAILPISTPSFANDMKVVTELKNRLPSVKIAIIGVHATAKHVEIVKKFHQIDFVIRNEPEFTAIEIVRALLTDAAFSEIRGLTWRETGEPRINPDRPFIENLDSLPFPAWEYINLRDYRLPFKGRPFLSVAPLRGCPYRCTFCTAGEYYGHKIRFRSVDSVIKEIKHDISRFDVRDFFMWAETFTIKRDFVLELAAAMKKETPGIRWTCNSRTDTVDEEMVGKMAEAGCWMMSFGIESTDPTVQKNMKKNLKIKDLHSPIRMTRKAGIRTVGHFILGMPGDTPETVEQTIQDAMTMDLDFAQFYTAAPFVGSELHKEAKRQGWLVNGNFEQMRQSRASLSLPGLPPEAVTKAAKRAQRAFYLRPRQIIRLIRFADFGIFYQAFQFISTFVRNLGGKLQG